MSQSISSSEKIQEYRPSGQEKGWNAKAFFAMFSDLTKAHELAKRLTKRDWKAQYRQSVLGMLWAVATPLLNTLVWLFLQETGIVRMEATGMPFAAFVFSGTMIWSIFVDSIQTPLRTTQQARNMMAKINFPKEALLLSGIYKVLGNAFIRVLLVLLFLFWFGIYPSSNIFLFPFLLILLIFFGTGLGVWLTPIGMLYHDVGRLLPYLLQGLMYFSPVLYAVPNEGLIGSLIRLNPLTPMVGNIRNVLAGEMIFQESYLWVLLPIVLVLFLFGWIFYRSAVSILIEKGN
jgi:lipopolysaccharide transport system permease protein